MYPKALIFCFRYLHLSHGFHKCWSHRLKSETHLVQHNKLHHRKVLLSRVVTLQDWVDVLSLNIYFPQAHCFLCIVRKSD